MKTQYQLLFRVDIAHSYFDSGNCSCLEFAPGAKTTRIQQRMDLIIRKNTNGFSLYLNTKNPPSERLDYLSSTLGTDAFDFVIRSSDPDFFAFTELPDDWLGQLLFDSSVQEGSGKNGMVQLAQQLTAGTGLGWIGTLSIRFQDLLRLSREEQAAQFCIRLQARSTQWQYFIINKSALELGSAVIQGDPAVAFDGPVPVLIPSGEAALRFSSGGTLLAFSESPRYRFHLMEATSEANGNGYPKKKAAKIIRSGLPNPDPTQTGSTLIEGKKQLTSPMYVYI